MPGTEPASLAQKTKPEAAGRSNLAVRIVSSLVLAPLAIGTAYFGGWVFALFWFAVAIAVWWEWNTLVSGPSNRLLFILGAGALALALSISILGMVRPPVLIIALGALAIAVFARSERRVWASGGLIYAGAVFAAPVLLRRDPDLGLIAVILLFAVVWATDILGYFVGRAIGGPKLLPQVSPKKTWSGAIGGVIGAVGIATAIAYLVELPNVWAVAAVALLLSVIALVGDLFESAVKRRFGAKDASQLIPGHGGFMDRIDGFVAAAVAAAVIGLAREGMDAAGSGLLLW